MTAQGKARPAAARVLIAGCGYVGGALGRALAAEGHAVYGLRRSPRVETGIQPICADLCDPDSLRALPPDLDFVFYTASAGGRDDARYRAAYLDGPRNLLAAMVSQERPPRRLFFTSSTAVYAQAAGEWVDEDSPEEAEDFAGRRLREGEEILREGPFPATVLRLGGIYGPGRTRLIDGLRAGSALLSAGPPHYTNRIHRDDCAGALRHLMHLEQPEPLYLGVDCEPADRSEVLRWLAARLGQPPLRNAGEPGGPPRPRGGHKRCCNARLLRAGYRFRYPTFREGYGALVDRADGPLAAK